jgi:TonB family protein
MPALERKDGTEISGSLPDAALEQQQRRRMLVALAVLLVALLSVLIKDHQFWFPPSPSPESEALEPNPPKAAAPTIPGNVATPPAPRAASHPVPAQARSKSKRLAVASNTSGVVPPVVITNRAVLPPLEVEVVAGNQHHTINPRDGSVKLDMQPSESAASEQPPASATNPDNALVASNAAARVELSPGTVQVVSRPVDPRYPLLAKQMKVQGAVILEALISKSGSIQDIQVLSGPAILSAAAREAVKQWHFKPYYQDGRPVETEARITVNFTISTY